VRLTAPDGTEYRHKAPLRLILEVQNTTDGPLPCAELYRVAEPEVADGAGKRLIARPFVGVSPWEGRDDNLPAGRTLRWEISFDRIVLSDRIPQPKAGDTLSLRFWLPLVGEAGKRAAAGKAAGPGAPGARSNTLTVTLKDAPAGPPPREAELSGKWDKSMELVFREHAALGGYRAVRVDGDGHLTVVGVGRLAKGAGGPTFFEGKVEQERLDRLAAALRTEKVWNLAGLPWDPPIPDGTEYQFYLGAGGRTLVVTLPEQAARARRDVDHIRGLLAELIAATQEEFAGREGGRAEREKVKARDGRSLYFPTRAGAKWVYAVTARKTTSEIVETVSAAEEKGSGYRVTTEIGSTPDANVRVVTDVSARGLYQAEFAGKVYADPVPLLKLPAKAGDSWTAEFEVPAINGKVRFTYTVKDEEEVEVPGGKFKALRVEWKADPDVLTMTATRWYAPGVGLVKEVTSSGGAGQTRVLKSFRSGP